jgi:hypothetical protein
MENLSVSIDKKLVRLHNRYNRCEEKKSVFFGTRVLIPPSSSPSLYRLSYPDSTILLNKGKAIPVPDRGGL